MSIMKIKFKLIALLIIFSLIIPAYTASAYSPQFEYEAQMLYDLELFKGTENGFELDGVCDRLQGATMFVRLLGQEKDATSNPKSHPFTDVKDSWASPYIGQMYEQGYTKGSSPTEYGTGNMTANHFATFCLRALDYQDGIDFSVDSALSKMLELHIIREDTFNLIANDNVFYRDYAVKLAYNTLAAEYKNRKTLPLIEQMVKDFYAGKVTEEELAAFLKPLNLYYTWDFFIKEGYDLNQSYYLKIFLDEANLSKEILLLDLYRKGVVSKDNLMKNIFWIEDDMFLYTLPELFDKYFESTIKEYKTTVIEKTELGLGDIINYKSPVLAKAWEAYDDTKVITTSNPFDLSNPSFSYTPYAVHRIDYGPMRKCEYYLRGIHNVELTDSEKKIVDFVQKEFLNKITDDMDAYDKVMLANQFLCDNFTYDKIAPTSTKKSFTYLFEEKKAVCAGFSQVFQFLMKIVDVECYVVDNIGVIPLPEGHAWNIVRLDDGNLYNVDTSTPTTNPFRPQDNWVEYIDKEAYYIDLTCSDPANIKR